MTGNRDTITSILPPCSSDAVRLFSHNRGDSAIRTMRLLNCDNYSFCPVAVLYYCIVLYDTKEQGTLGWELIIAKVRFHGLCISKKFQVQYQMCFCKANINFIFKQSKKGDRRSSNNKNHNENIFKTKKNIKILKIVYDLLLNSHLRDKAKFNLIIA